MEYVPIASNDYANILPPLLLSITQAFWCSLFSLPTHWCYFITLSRLYYLLRYQCCFPITNNENVTYEIIHSSVCNSFANTVIALISNKPFSGYKSYTWFLRVYRNIMPVSQGSGISHLHTGVHPF